MEVLKINEYTGHKGGIYSVAKSKKNHIVYTGGSDEYIIAWDLFEPNNSKALASLPVKAYAIKNIHDQNMLWVGNFAGGIHVIDLDTKKEIKLLHLHTSTIFSIQYIPHKKECIVVSADGSFSVWSSLDYRLLFHKKISEKRIRTIDIKEETNEIALGSSDGNVYVMDLNEYRIKNTLIHPKEYQSITSIAFHPNKSILITGSRGYLTFWDSINWKITHTIAAHKFAIYSIEFSPDNSLFATCSLDKTIRIWDANSFTLLKEINRKDNQGHNNSINALLWSNYNDYLISISDDRTIMTWKIIP